MPQLKVIVSQLNRRKSLPGNFSENNIVGTAQKGFLFEGVEVNNDSNPSLGKWYIDRDGYFYWGGGLLLLDRPPGNTANLKPVPKYSSSTQGWY